MCQEQELLQALMPFESMQYKSMQQNSLLFCCMLSYRQCSPGFMACASTYDYVRSCAAEACGALFISVSLPQYRLGSTLWPARSSCKCQLRAGHVEGEHINAPHIGCGYAPCWQSNDAVIIIKVRIRPGEAALLQQLHRRAVKHLPRKGSSSPTGMRVCKADDRRGG